MTETPPDPDYRPCVGAFLINAEGLVFVGQRASSDDPAWQMPQGGIERQENPQKAVLRELAEETGVRTVKILARSKSWLSYDFPPELRASVWEGRYRGQTQIWFALRFLGTEAEIDLNAGPVGEFSAWKWVAADETPALVVPFKRPVYKAVVAEFGQYASPDSVPSTA